MLFFETTTDLVVDISSTLSVLYFSLNYIKCYNFVCAHAAFKESIQINNHADAALKWKVIKTKISVFIINWRVRY